MKALTSTEAEILRIVSFGTDESEWIPEADLAEFFGLEVDELTDTMRSLWERGHVKSKVEHRKGERLGRFLYATKR